MRLYLIKYPAEIGTKQPRQQQKLIALLSRNIERAIKGVHGEAVLEDSSVKADRNHILVYAPEPLDDALERIPGINYFTEARKVQVASLDQLVQTAHDHFQPVFREGLRFAVRCRKTGSLPFRRRDVEVKLGNLLTPYGKTHLNDPDLTCHVEIRDKTAYLYSNKRPGMGGLPIGSQGKALNLLSGGIDSPVAAWRLFRTGMDQDFVYFDLGGEAQKEAIMEVFHSLQQRFGYGSRTKLLIVDFLPVIEEILKARRTLQNLILKYCFYKAGEQLARYHSCEALVTGEAIGQVSTQTSRNLSTLDRIADIMIIRPLSTSPKAEIMDQARRIGTFDISYKGKEFCALSTKKVTTGTSLTQLMKEVKQLKLSNKLHRAVEMREMWTINETGDWHALENPYREQHLANTSAGEKMEPDLSITLENADKVIDLRDDDEKQEADGITGSEMIPFEQAWEDYFHWDKEPCYYLVCNYGSKSKILAHYMRKEGFRAGHLEGGLTRYSTSTA